MLRREHQPGLRQNGASASGYSDEREHRQPPHNIPAEQALLGAIFVSNKAYGRVSGFLDPQHFYDPLHHQIYETAGTLIAEGKVADPITLLPFFEHHEPIDANTSVPVYLGLLAVQATTIIKVRDYACTIRDLSIRRRTILLAEDMQKLAYETPADFSPSQQIAEHQKRLIALDGETRERDSASALEFDDQIMIETSVDALVKGVLHPGDVAALYGESGVGKTFAAIDLAYHVALGQPWHGRRVRQAPVLYVGLEGVRGLRHRIAAYRQHMGYAGRMLARLTIHAPLNKTEVGKSGENIIIEQAKLLGRAADKPVGLIIIDTLARAIAGDDENSARDMAAFVDRVSAIARETGAAVLVVHHPGKDGTRGMRGSYALFAACDAVIKISGNGDLRDVATEKVKEGMIGPLFSYTLKPVSLGTDEDGDEITSCTVEPVLQPDRKAQRPRPETPAGKALNELEQMIITGAGVPAQGHLRAPDGAMLIARANWRSACRQRCLSDGTPENEKKAFQRAVATLLSANLISDYGDVVWPITQRRRGQDDGDYNGH